MPNQTQSETLYQRACDVIPGGVNSPVRAFKGVGGTPVFFNHAEGIHLVDVDGNRYIDYVASWGPMLRGFSYEPVIEAVQSQSRHAMSFGAPTEIEVQMAELICERIPSIEKVRMVNSGTEATMSAIRLARGVTNRNKIIKFEGGFHGHGDSLLVKAGSGVLTLGLPDSPGVPQELAQHTLTLPFNNTETLKEAFATFPNEIACVIVEPIGGNMGCIPPVEGFLDAIRESTRNYGALLIFDEVMTGFRVARGGAQALYNVTPDLTTLGKVIGGGLPVGAFGGTTQYMDSLAPVGSIYQSGTLSGNPLAMRSGYALLSSLDEDVYKQLGETTERLVQGIEDLASTHQVPLAVNHVCAMFSIFFTELAQVENFSHVTQSDVARYQKFFHALLDEGIYMAPSAFESAFISTQHDDEIINQTLQAFDKVFAQL